MVRYENEILSAYVVKKFNDLILPSGDRVVVEYLNEEFLRNFFLLNTTLNNNSLISSTNQIGSSSTSPPTIIISSNNGSSSNNLINNNNNDNYSINNGKLNSGQQAQHIYAVQQKEIDFINNTTNNNNCSNNNNFKADQNLNSSMLFLNSKLNNQVYFKL